MFPQGRWVLSHVVVTCSCQDKQVIRLFKQPLRETLRANIAVSLRGCFDYKKGKKKKLDKARTTEKTTNLAKVKIGELTQL